MKITYTSYRPLAYWKWVTKSNQELPPIPPASSSAEPDIESESDSDSDTDRYPIAGPSTSTNSLCSLSDSVKADKVTRRNTRIEQAKSEARRQAGEKNENEDDDDEDCCGICQEAFEACCPTCRMPGEECPLMYGKCSHVFHMHCILHWLKDERMSKGKCPLDRRPFEIAEQFSPTEPDAILAVGLTRAAGESNVGGAATEDDSLNDISDDSMESVTRLPVLANLQQEREAV